MPKKIIQKSDISAYNKNDIHCTKCKAFNNAREKTALILVKDGKYIFNNELVKIIIHFS